MSTRLIGRSEICRYDRGTARLLVMATMAPDMIAGKGLATSDVLLLPVKHQGVCGDVTVDAIVRNQILVLGSTSKSRCDAATGMKLGSL